MSEEGKAPKLGDWVRQRIFQRFGIAGLVAVAVLGAGIYVWSHWTEVDSWPGVSNVAGYLGREDLPKADPTRFSVAVAHLEEDIDSRL